MIYNLFLIKVIFVLSTIVAVTDCCSSRILLLREHTLKIVQHNFHNHLHEHAHELQQQIEQHVANLVNQMELNKTLLQEQIDSSEMIAPPTENPLPLSTAVPVQSLDRPPPVSSTVPPIEPIASSTEPDIIIAGTHTTQKFDLTDIYLTIMRDVLSLECSGQYLTDYCLNGGRCFRYPVGNHSIFSCECADGYIGERCESKSLNELYVPLPLVGETKQPKVLMARIVFSFPMLIVLSSIYILFGAFYVFRGTHVQNGHASGYKQPTTGLFAS